MKRIKCIQRSTCSKDSAVDFSLNYWGCAFKKEEEKETSLPLFTHNKVFSCNLNYGDLEI